MNRDPGPAAGRAGRLLRLALPPLLVFVVTLAVYWNSPSEQTGSDTIWSIILADSIVRERDVDLDEFRSIIPSHDGNIVRVNGHDYSLFPIGAPLLAAPFVALYEIINPRAHEQLQQIQWPLDWHIASILTALTTVVIYLIARRFLTVKQSVVVAFIFAFCTSAWSTASRALWQHTASILVLSLALYIALLARERPWVIQLAGLPLAFSFVSRPTNSISIILFSLYVAIRYRGYLLQYLLWAALVAVPFFAINWTTHHAFLTPYYQPQRIGEMNRFFEAAAGNLVSPARGLFLFTPVFLLCAYGIYLKVKGFRAGEQDLLLDVFLVLAIVLHWLAVSSFPHWWAGYSYGPRFFTDMTPYLVYFLIPVIPALVTWKRGVRPGLVALGILALASFGIHYRGAMDRATFLWNHLPVSVDLKPARLWDWHDLMFLRNIPALDPLIPAQMVVEPRPIDVTRSGGRNGESQRVINLYDIRYRNCDWTVEAPPGVMASVSREENTSSLSLVITVPTESYPEGSHYLGELVVSAVRTGGDPARAERVSIPIHVRDFDYAYFLPFVGR
jgi:hypothetical protein